MPSIQYRNLIIGLMSVYAALVMLTGYGFGMLKAIFMRFVFKSSKESEKPEITKGLRITTLDLRFDVRLNVFLTELRIH